jgi:antitoxin component YwqK of YwqJK toxin-antitoxin module
MFVGIANAQNACQYDYADLEHSDNKSYYKNEPVNGLACSYPDIIGDTNVKIERPYKNGLLEGVVKVYREGILHVEIPYRNGLTEGIFKLYHDNGKPMSETPYKNDLKEGIARLYYENGQLYEETPYKNNLKEGYEMAYTENGQLDYKILYKKGEIISGVCANGREITPDELSKIEDYESPNCNP